MYVFMVTTFSSECVKPGMVANPARGQLDREIKYFPLLICA